MRAAFSVLTSLEEAFPESKHQLASFRTGSAGSRMHAIDLMRSADCSEGFSKVFAPGAAFYII
jgi:hypothetical protein